MDLWEYMCISVSDKWCISDQIPTRSWHGSHQHQMPCMTVANVTNARDCIVGNGHILQWDLMSKINSVYGTSAGNTMRCIHDESLSTLRYAVKSSFASVNLVNVGLNHWFCSPILLLILVIELRNRTIHLAIETCDRADQATEIRGTVSPVNDTDTFRQYRYRTVSC